MTFNIGDKAEIIHTKKSLADYQLKGEQGILGRMDQAVEGKPDCIFLYDGDEVELLKNVLIKKVPTTINMIQDFA